MTYAQHEPMEAIRLAIRMCVYVGPTGDTATASHSLP